MREKKHLVCERRVGVLLEKLNLNERREAANARLREAIERAQQICKHSSHVRRTNRKLKQILLEVPPTVLVRVSEGELELKVLGQNRSNMKRKSPLTSAPKSF